MIIAGQAQVHPTTAYQMRNNAIAWDEAAVPHFEQVTAPVHEHGALAFLQLAHNGGVNDGTWSKLPAWAPSAVANYNEPPKPLEHDEIRELVEYFARSAANAAAGGFDGIEVHGAHGYLIHEFLSPKSNHRTDEYGGSLENRMRFCVEVLDAVRCRGGRRRRRRSPPRRRRGQRDGSGLTADDAAEIAARLEDAGLVDFVNVSVGISGMGMVRPLYAPHLLGVYAAHTVKKALRDTPVFAVHRVLTPDEAEGILERGEADAVTLVRALIADPDWGAKARAGADDDDPPLHRLQPGLLREPDPESPDQLRDESGGRSRDGARCGHAASGGGRETCRRRRRGTGRARSRVGRGGARSRGDAARAVRRSSAARSVWLSSSRAARSSPTSPTGGSGSAIAAASTCGSESRRPPTMCSR